MPNDGNGLRLTDGQFSFIAGVNSDAPRTKRVPGVLDDGLLPNQLSWLINGMVRGGGISQRHTVHPVVQDAPWSGRFQGKFLYQPDYGMPIMIAAIGGRIYRIRVDTDNSVTDLTALYGVPVLPVNETHFFFAQAEMFLVIQAGDLTTLPLIYDFGVEGERPETLRQSLGITQPGVVTNQNEIPAARAMKFYAQRLWYAFGRGYAAGDISGNTTSGTQALDYRDSVIKVTENPVAYAGDSFLVPTSDGDVRSLDFAANIDSSVGEAQLYVSTRRTIYSCVAPVTRAAWTAADNDAQPLQRVALKKGGVYSDRAVVVVNDDLFFQSPPNGDIRTVITAQRQTNTWGQVPISNNINRALQFNDRSLLHDGSGILFDNLMLQTCLPLDIPGIGTGHQALSVLDFDTISTLQERLPPSWVGVWDFSGGPYIMQLSEGDFGGRERAFAMVWAVERSALEVWELRPDLRFDHGDGSETSGDRVTRVIEFPAYAFGDPLALKELVGAEFWIDKLLGTADFELYYRPDGYACWLQWHAWQRCATRDCRDHEESPCADSGYPQARDCEQDAIPMVVGPPRNPICIPGNNRPSTWGFQFQMRLVIRGWCRIRGDMLTALHRIRPAYGENVVCGKEMWTLLAHRPLPAQLPAPVLPAAPAALPDPLEITTAALAAGTQGMAYSDTVLATGGTLPYSWSIDSGVLPAGLSIAAATGIISGTPTTVETQAFVVRVDDSSSGDFAIQSLSITVNAPVLPSTGLILQLESDDFDSSVDLTAVSQWSDKSGNLNHFVQATGTDQPWVDQTILCNGHATIRTIVSGAIRHLEKTTQWLGAPPGWDLGANPGADQTSDGIEVLVIGIRDDDPPAAVANLQGSPFKFGTGTVGASHIPVDTGDCYENLAHAVRPNSGNPVTAMDASFFGYNVRAFRSVNPANTDRKLIFGSEVLEDITNTVAYSQPQNPTPNPAGLMIGASFTGDPTTATNSWSGNIAAVYVWSGILNASERAALANYILAKWGVVIPIV